MGDAADILCVQRPSSPKLKQPFKNKNRDGMSREAVALGGHALPSIVPTLSFKEKRKRDKPVHWEWKAFANSAREDGALFHHWQKEGVQWDDYPFARFNKKSSIMTYTDDEYSKYLQTSGWTKDETDRLMDMAKRFDQRWIVIHDRYHNTSRSAEDLKDRFYWVQTRLLETRDTSGGDEIQDHPLIIRPYQKEYEVQRKAHLERLFARSKDIERDEQLLLDEAKKIQQSQKKREKERKRAMEKVRQNSKKASERAAPVLTEEQLTVSGGCCLRSQLMKAALDVTPKTAQKVNLVLEAVGLGNPLASDQTQVCYQGLRESIVALLEWQKYLQKKKYEYDNLKLRKQEMLRPVAKSKRGAAGGGEPAGKKRR